MQRYRKSLASTEYAMPNKDLLKVHIDYNGLLAYAKSRGKAVPDLSDEEKNRFILNSNMENIRILQQQ
jgi:hypothetical protein